MKLPRYTQWMSWKMWRDDWCKCLIKTIGFLGFIEAFKQNAFDTWKLWSLSSFKSLKALKLFQKLENEAFI